MQKHEWIHLNVDRHLTAFIVTAYLPSGEMVDALAQSDDQIVETAAWFRNRPYSDRFHRGTIIEKSWNWLFDHEMKMLTMSSRHFYEDSPLQFTPVMEREEETE